MEIVCVFGPLKAYHFEVNGDLNEPCAFLEVIEKHVKGVPFRQLRFDDLFFILLNPITTLPFTSRFLPHPVSFINIQFFPCSMQINL